MEGEGEAGYPITAPPDKVMLFQGLRGRDPHTPPPPLSCERGGCSICMYKVQPGHTKLDNAYFNIQHALVGVIHIFHA
jgi:hypothetical protein